jgi:quercetin dioxygenase-like cupin family protein
MQSLRFPRFAGAVSLAAGAVAAATLIAQSPQPGAAAGASHMVSAKSIVWQAAPPSMPPGAKVAVLHGDPAKEGPFVMRIKAPDGFKVPAHYHPTDEHLTVIQGTFMVGTGEKADPAGLKPLATGDYTFMPKEMRHYGQMKGETIIQVNGMGPFQITYVNPDEDPRNKKTPSQ